MIYYIKTNKYKRIINTTSTSEKMVYNKYIIKGHKNKKCNLITATRILILKKGTYFQQLMLLIPSSAGRLV